MRQAPLTASVLLLLLTIAACTPAAGVTTGTQPPPPQFVFNKSFPSDKGSMQVTLDHEVYPPHYAGLWHTHPGPGSLCVLQGTLTVEVAGQPDVPLPAGSCWVEPPDVAHRPTNQSDQQAVALFYLMAPAGRPRIQAAPTPTPRQQAGASRKRGAHTMITFGRRPEHGRVPERGIQWPARLSRDRTMCCSEAATLSIRAAASAL